MNTAAAQPEPEGQTGDEDTALVTWTLTRAQLQVIAATVKERQWVIRSTDGLLAKEVLYNRMNDQTEAVETLVQETQAAAAELLEAIKLESFLLVFTTTNPSAADLETFAERLRQDFPDARRYYRHMEKDPKLGKNRVFHVYTSVDAGAPDPKTIGQVIHGLQGVDYRQTLRSWQGDRAKCLERHPWIAIT